MATALRVKFSDRAGLWWERFHPPILGAIAVAVYAVVGRQAMVAMAESGWQIGSVYSSVFDVSSVFTAFLFTFYTMIVTTDRGFIGRMKNTRAYKLLKDYAVHALALGGAAIAASVPLMVIEPKPTDVSSPWHLAIALWFGLSIWTCAGFVRAARLFVAFIRQYD